MINVTSVGKPHIVLNAVVREAETMDMMVAAVTVLAGACAALAVAWIRQRNRAQRLERLLALREELDEAMSAETVNAMLTTWIALTGEEADEAATRFAQQRIEVLHSLALSNTAAAVDTLTGLWNRRMLDIEATRLSQQNELYSVAIADLDYFKVLNDTHGHDLGDVALVVFAQSLLASVGHRDVVCRMGGEEFIVVFPGVTQGHAAEAMQRVRAYLKAELRIRDLPEVTASFGISESTMAETFDTVVQLADQALLRAKRSGRDQIQTASRPGRYHEIVRNAA